MICNVCNNKEDTYNRIQPLGEVDVLLICNPCINSLYSTTKEGSGREVITILNDALRSIGKDRYWNECIKR